jgi:secreted PhoX family phosphatase
MSQFFSGARPTRRSLLKSGTILLGASAASSLTPAVAHAFNAGRRRENGGFGPLIEAPELALPKDFRFVALSPAGSLMSDGRKVPFAHDGMGAFAGPRGRTILVRKHELEVIGTAIDPRQRAYDRLAPGGCTTLVYNPISRRVEESFLSLNGTLTNCAGGPTPWGSWLSCEETTEGVLAGFERPHGYIFEVPANARGIVEPVPLKSMGRFVHEAAAVDPRTGIVYLTEDEGPDGFYRFLPHRPGKLAAGGKLQMAAIAGEPQYDTASGQEVGRRLPVRWVDIDEPDPSDAEQNPSAVLEQGAAKGAALWAGLEGCSYHDGQIFLSASDGGDAELGQVWRYVPTAHDRGFVELLFESTGDDQLDGPDNNAGNPWGGVLICEDGEDGTDSFLRGLNQQGELFTLARNTTSLDLSLFDDDYAPGELFGFSEFAGVRFGPDGFTLFVNVQYPGTTYAIVGPFWRGV